MRCTQATIRALGVHGQPDPRTQWQLAGALRSGGRKVEFMLLHEIAGTDPGMPEARVTLGEFMARFPSGSFAIFTSRHAMALVDGQLTDTAHGGPSRQVVCAFRVSNH